MARRGRKRRIGLRHPGGDLVQPRPDARSLATLQPHRVWLPEEQRMDQKAASPLGCLNLLGVLGDAQYMAGIRYAVVVGKYRAVIETPRATAGAGRGTIARAISCAAAMARRANAAGARRATTRPSGR
jgi:hypothetical protein